MTAENFEDKIKGTFKNDDTVNYLLCYLVIAIGLFFIYKIWDDGLPPFYGIGRYAVLVLPLIPISFGCYGLWRISKTYRIGQLSSTKSVIEKEKVIDEFLQQLDIIKKNFEDNILNVRYRNKFFTEIDVRFYWDDNKILFNAEGADMSGLKGIIDFGIGKRSMMRIKRHLEDCL
jgi:hypothetical protein